VLVRSTSIEENSALSPSEVHAEFVEVPASNRAARGAITGVFLGAGLWGAILVLAGVIKL
jgi:hypothetical protein